MGGDVIQEIMIWILRLDVKELGQGFHKMKAKNFICGSKLQVIGLRENRIEHSVAKCFHKLTSPNGFIFFNGNPIGSFYAINDE
jgi:hypothetical protein